MKPQPETLRRACLSGHTAPPVEIRTRTPRPDRMLHRLAADQEGHTTVGMALLIHANGEWDEEELAAMDAVVHWFGD